MQPTCITTFVPLPRFINNPTNLPPQTNGSAIREQRIRGILNGSNIFFTGANNNIMYEVACEPPNTCDTDNYSFKAYLSRWMAASTKYAPFILELVMPKLRASAIAAVQQCSGGSNGQMCGQRLSSTATT